MKSLIYSLAVMSVAVCLASCGDPDYITYDRGQKDQLFFIQDSVNFIYGFKSDEAIDLSVAAGLMGFVNTEEDRSFSVQVNRELTTAVEGTHFRILPGTRMMQDSLRGYVDLDFDKAALELGRQYVLTLDLVEDVNYRPANRKQCRVYFGNMAIPAPIWWQAQYVGEYTQAKFILFVEMFSRTETLSPEFHRIIKGYWGPTLQLETYSRARYLLTTAAYQGYLKRYILGPMYEYYLETENPDYQIPNPN